MLIFSVTTAQVLLDRLEADPDVAFEDLGRGIRLYCRVFEDGGVNPIAQIDPFSPTESAVPLRAWAEVWDIDDPAVRDALFAPNKWRTH